MITGASDGIGAAAARALTTSGHHVVLVGRSATKTAEIAADLGTPYFLADFSDLSQVRHLAAEIAAACPRIDVLANNAGGIFGDRQLTVDGLEKTMQVNHFAPFLLTNLLIDTLLDSRATVINTSSLASRAADIDVDDLTFDRRYSANRAYGASKLANVLFTKELQRRYGDRGLSSAAFHPGIIASNFASETNTLWRYLYHSPLRRVTGMLTSEEGARDLIWLAETTPGAEWTPGGYYDKHKIGRTSPLADDQDLARELWDRSAELIGLL
ncbi:SDR family NAD(P)-dependent oxidoreductase [Microbacterium sp. cf046]|uniref:SDR family NAD(P)-dependent oxidoreductase n=1 Tax=Microbacterium sp. cf046 TaxID=1761803 RepID=UPI0020C88C8F|nr:SDR family NAD(P)-dependent oxidoreductase [Microbacterium sp. cf046]